MELPFRAVTPCYPRKPTGIQRFCQSFGTFLCCRLQRRAQCAVGEGAFPSQTNLGTRVLAGLGSIASKSLWATASPPSVELAAPPALSSIRFLLPVSCRALRAPLAPHHIQTHPIGRGWCSSCSLARAEGWLGQQQAGQRSDTLSLVAPKGHCFRSQALPAPAVLPNLGVRPPPTRLLSVYWC